MAGYDDIGYRDVPLKRNRSRAHVVRGVSLRHIRRAEAAEARRAAKKARKATSSANENSTTT